MNHRQIYREKPIVSTMQLYHRVGEAGEESDRKPAVAAVGVFSWSSVSLV